MALIKGKQIQDTSVSLGKLSGAGSVTITGTITTPAASLIVNTAPTQATHAVNKEYVDSVATGLDVKKSVKAIYTENTPAGGGTPAINITNTAGGAQFTLNDIYGWMTTGSPIPQPLVLDGIVINDNDRVLIVSNTPTRQKINGIWVYAAGEFTRAEDADNQTPAGEVSGGMFTFVEEGEVYGDTGWVLSFPNGPITTMWDPNYAPSATTDIQFTQFSAAGVAEAGVGLSRTGTKFDVNYDNSSIGINGSDQLYVKANGITNDMILNEYITFAGDSGSGNVTFGNTLTIAGTSTGIDTSFSGSTLTISLDLSELSTVTTITDSDFIAGVSSVGTGQKITFGNLKALIGAASQLAIGVEGGVAASFDLDTDTLNFVSGPGLTFTRNTPLAGTTDTLTVTISNNALSVDQFPGIALAIGGNSDFTLGDLAAEVFSVTLNGVALKKGSQWEWPFAGDADVVRIKGLPYAMETSDDIEITYRMQ